MPSTIFPAPGFNSSTQFLEPFAGFNGPVPFSGGTLNNLVVLSEDMTTLTTVGQQSYSTAGTYTWTAPAGVTSAAIVVIGGGGGGGGNGSGGSAWNGSGGGGGGLAYANSVTVTPGANYTVQVGAGGTSDTNGGISWFNSSTYLFANGGNKGVGGSTSGATGQQLITTTGASNWTVPSGVFSIDVALVGGGGSGGLGNGAGGGGGALAYANNISVTPGTVYNVNVGTGGVTYYLDPTTAPFPNTYVTSFTSASSQYIQASYNSNQNFGSSNFTIEAWIYPTATPASSYGIVNNWNIGGEFIFQLTSSRFLAFNYTNAASGVSTVSFTGTTQTVPLNSWSHIAVVRNGATITLYVNGQADATTNSIGAGSLYYYNGSAKDLYIGVNADITAGTYFSGKMTNLRIVNGIAVYTGNFTPPTSVLSTTQSSGTNISQISSSASTVLLMLNSAGFTDSSSTSPALTITPFNSPTVTAAATNLSSTSSWFSNSSYLYAGGGSKGTDGPNNLGQQTFTTAGSNTWTAPSGVSSVDVVLVGGGGGGGFGNGAGGGGGALTYANNVTVTAGTVYSLNVGTGGIGGTGSGSGGTSWFNSSGYLYANGGNNGTNGPNAIGQASAVYPSTVAGTGMANISTGNFQWTAPAGVTSVNIVAIGGGGGGASLYNGSGGGGGALTYANNVSVTPGTAYTIAVGAGGAKDNSGGTTWFNTSSYLYAGGGARGYPNNSIPVQGQATFNGAGAGNYTASGNSILNYSAYTWTCPDGVTSISAVVVGGGGGNSQQGGGGGGGLSYGNNIPVTPGQTYTIKAGNAGGILSKAWVSGGGSGSNNVTLTDTVGLYIGMRVSNGYLLSLTPTITSITGNTIYISSTFQNYVNVNGNGATFYFAYDAGQSQIVNNSTGETYLTAGGGVTPWQGSNAYYLGVFNSTPRYGFSYGYEGGGGGAGGYGASGGSGYSSGYGTGGAGGGGTYSSGGGNGGNGGTYQQYFQVGAGNPGPYYNYGYAGGAGGGWGAGAGGGNGYPGGVGGGVTLDGSANTTYAGPAATFSGYYSGSYSITYVGNAGSGSGSYGYGAGGGAYYLAPPAVPGVGGVKIIWSNQVTRAYPNTNTGTMSTISYNSSSVDTYGGGGGGGAGGYESNGGNGGTTTGSADSGGGSGGVGGGTVSSVVAYSGGNGGSSTNSGPTAYSAATNGTAGGSFLYTYGGAGAGGAGGIYPYSGGGVGFLGGSNVDSLGSTTTAGAATASSANATSTANGGSGGVSGLNSNGGGSNYGSGGGAGVAGGNGAIRIIWSLNSTVPRAFPATTTTDQTTVTYGAGSGTNQGGGGGAGGYAAAGGAGGSSSISGSVTVSFAGGTGGTGGGSVAGAVTYAGGAGGGSYNSPPGSYMSFNAATNTGGGSGAGGSGGVVAQGGGGVGLLGQTAVDSTGQTTAAGTATSYGANGATAYNGGSGGSSSVSGAGGAYGGGSTNGSNGTQGAVRIIWGYGRTFPSTLTTDVTPVSYTANSGPGGGGGGAGGFASAGGAGGSATSVTYAGGTGGTGGGSVAGVVTYAGGAGGGSNGAPTVAFNAATSPGGGAGAGGSGGVNPYGGGGVGLAGQTSLNSTGQSTAAGSSTLAGASAASAYNGGSGGADGTALTGGAYGGGGANYGPGAQGAIRIMWQAATRSYPSTLAADQTTYGYSYSAGGGGGAAGYAANGGAGAGSTISTYAGGTGGTGGGTVAGVVTYTGGTGGAAYNASITYTGATAPGGGAGAGGSGGVYAQGGGGVGNQGQYSVNVNNITTTAGSNTLAGASAVAANNGGSKGFDGTVSVSTPVATLGGGGLIGGGGPGASNTVGGAGGAGSVRIIWGTIGAVARTFPTAAADANLVAAPSWSAAGYTGSKDAYGVNLLTASGNSSYLYQQVTVLPSTAYTFSFYARPGTATDATYSVYDDTNGANIVAATSYYSTINRTSTITAIGTSAASTITLAVPFLNTYSTSFGGSNTIYNSAVDVRPTADFTLEGWFYFTGTGQNIILQIGNEATGRINFSQTGTTGVLAYNIFGSGSVNLTATTVANNTWAHIAIVRIGTSMTTYVNGTGGTPVTLSGTLGNATGFYVMGGATPNGQGAGFVSNLRLVLGTGVYTANFGPVYSPLGNIANTKLLLCQSSSPTKDNSTNNYTLTNFGSVGNIDGNISLYKSIISTSGITNGTTISSITNTTLTLSAALTAAVSGTVTFRDTTWSRIAVTFTTPATCRSLRVYPLTTISSGFGSTYLTGIQLERGSSATGYQITNASSLGAAGIVPYTPLTSTNTVNTGKLSRAEVVKGDTVIRLVSKIRVANTLRTVPVSKISPNLTFGNATSLTKPIEVVRLVPLSRISLGTTYGNTAKINRFKTSNIANPANDSIVFDPTLIAKSPTSRYTFSNPTPGDAIVFDPNNLNKQIEKINSTTALSLTNTSILPSDFTVTTYAGQVIVGQTSVRNPTLYTISTKVNNGSTVTVTYSYGASAAPLMLSTDLVLITDTVTRQQVLTPITNFSISGNVSFRIPVTALASLNINNTWTFQIWDAGIAPTAKVRATNFRDSSAPSIPRNILWYSTMLGNYRSPSNYTWSTLPQSLTNTSIRPSDFAVTSYNGQVIVGQTSAKNSTVITPSTKINNGATITVTSSYSSGIFSNINITSTDLVLITDTVTRQQVLTSISNVTSSSYFASSYIYNVSFTVPSTVLSSLNINNTWTFQVWDAGIAPTVNVRATNFRDGSIPRNVFWYQGMGLGISRRAGGTVDIANTSPVNVFTAPKLKTAEVVKASNANIFTNKFDYYKVTSIPYSGLPGFSSAAESILNRPYKLADFDKFYWNYANQANIGQFNPSNTTSYTVISTNTSSGSTRLNFRTTRTASYGDFTSNDAIRIADSVSGFSAITNVTYATTISPIYLTASQQTFTSGSGTFTVPDNVYSLGVVCVGGGGSGYSIDNLGMGIGGGGGGGGLGWKMLSVFPGQRLLYSVGRGGGGTAQANISFPGGDTTVTDLFRTVLVAGYGGQGGGNDTGGAGGSYVGDGGGNGGNGGGGDSDYSALGAGGGGAGGYSGNGGNGAYAGEYIVNFGGGGALGTNSFIADSTVGITIGQSISGTGLAAGTTVTNVNAGTSTITVSNNFSPRATGQYVIFFKATAGAGGGGGGGGASTGDSFSNGGGAAGGGVGLTGQGTSGSAGLSGIGDYFGADNPNVTMGGGGSGGLGGIVKNTSTSLTVGNLGQWAYSNDRTVTAYGAGGGGGA